LDLYARQLAWLNQPIDPKAESSRSRGEIRQEKKHPLCLPSVESGWLLEALHELGWWQATGMGFSAVSHAEISSWCALMQIDLDPWEVQAIRSASRAYCIQGSSKDPREPNFQEPTDKPMSAIRAMAEAMNKKPS
jgi:hypothetical protein